MSQKTIGKSIAKAVHKSNGVGKSFWVCMLSVHILWRISVSQTPGQKVRRNITLSPDVLAEAQDLGINVSAVSEAALREAVKTARLAQWHTENARAIAERARYFDNEELPVSDVSVQPSDK